MEIEKEYRRRKNILFCVQSCWIERNEVDEYKILLSQIKDNKYKIRIKTKEYNYNDIRFFKQEEFIFSDDNYFLSIYTKIKNMDFEKMLNDNYFGDDGCFFYVTIGARDCHKNIRLWSPDEYSKNNEIKALVTIYNEIKIKIKFNEWIKKENKEFKKYMIQVRKKKS